MKNKMEDLRNHVFSALERLDDDELTEEQLKKELKRANAIAQLASVLNDTAKTEILFMAEFGKDKQSDFFKNKQLYLMVVAL